MQASDVTSLLFSQLNFRGERQKVIASNIANLNTPEYKTKDLSFQDHLQNTNQDLPLYVTNSKHIPFDLDDAPKTSNMKQYEVKGLDEQNDGNNVNLDQQMSEMAKNSVMYDAISNSIKKDALFFKMVIDASAKN